jgi:CubicO group peptidase (beta-lactamase class C family)
VADELIQNLGKMSWGGYLKLHVFDPLGMQRTVTKKQTDDDNVANAYIALSDGDFWQVTEPDGEDGEILVGAISVRSCIRDLSW